MAQGFPSRCFRLPFLLLALLLPLTGAALPLRATAARAVQAAVPTTGFQFVDIPVGDGTVLKANYIAPATPGPHPTIVFISSWGLNDLEYLAQAGALAQRGYVALSYTPRGFWLSGGGIDTAGPADIADTSRVIDWLLAHTPADGSRIGLAGVSYGAGISLIASGFDSRVKAVLKSELDGYTTSKSGVTLLPDTPLPAKLVKRLVQVRLAEIATRGKKPAVASKKTLVTERVTSSAVKEATGRDWKAWMRSLDAAGAAVGAGHAAGGALARQGRDADARAGEAL